MTALPRGIQIIATGSFIPDIKVTNSQIATTIDTSDTWIINRTGISARHVLEPRSSLVDMAVKAANKALENSTLNALDIDLILLATSTPDNLFGSAPEIQSLLGAKNAVAFDLTAACSGFIVGLINAYQFIQAGTYKNVLLIGADILSRWTDWTDRKTCILFGDAAGAAILQPSFEKNILGFKLETDGTLNKHLQLPVEDSDIFKVDEVKIPRNMYKFISMNGQEVYKAAISKVSRNILYSLKIASVSTSEIKWLLLHQANKRILYALAEKLGISVDKVLINLEEYGNTSAASIPVLLDETIKAKKIFKGDTIVLAGFGAGFTLGSIILRWV